MIKILKRKREKQMITSCKRWNQNKIVVDNIFSYNIIFETMQQNENLKSKFVDKINEEIKQTVNQNFFHSMNTKRASS